MSEKDSVPPVGSTQNGPIIWDEGRVKDLLEFIELPSNSVDKKTAVKKEIQDFISSLTLELQELRANEEEINESQSSFERDDFNENSLLSKLGALKGFSSSVIILKDIVSQKLFYPVIAPAIFVLLKSIWLVFHDEATNQGEILLLIFCDPTLMGVFTSNFFYELLSGVLSKMDVNESEIIGIARGIAILAGISFLLMFIFLKAWNNPYPSLVFGIPIIIIEFSLTTVFYGSLVYIKRNQQEVLR